MALGVAIAAVERLEVVFDFLLGKAGNDCRTGNHGHKGERNQDVVHGELL